MIARAWTSRWLLAAAVAAAMAMMVGGTPSCSRGGVQANLGFTLKDMNGQDVRLAAFKGRPILLNFWATWCPPCKAEIPWLVEFAAKYKELAVVGISVDDPPEDIRAFAQAHTINYPLLVGDKHPDVRQAYEANDVIPVSWFIKADGTVLTKAQGIHPKDWFEANIKTLVGDGDGD